MQDELNKVVDILKKGGVILTPTDTVWGLSCDASNEKAVSKVYQIKQRQPDKSPIILLDKFDNIYKYVETIPKIAKEIVELSVNPITIIYPNAKNLPDNVVNKDGSVAIRIINDAFFSKIIKYLKNPIVSTSANISNEKLPKTFTEINKNIIKSVDYIVKIKEQGTNKPSPIIKINLDNSFEMIRK